MSLPYLLLSCSVLVPREKQCYQFLVYFSRDRLVNHWIFDYQNVYSKVTSCLTFLLGVGKEKATCFEHSLRMDRK